MANLTRSDDFVCEFALRSFNVLDLVVISHGRSYEFIRFFYKRRLFSPQPQCCLTFL